MNENDKTLIRNILGPILFVAGAAIAVLVGFTLLSGLPAETAGGTKGLARTLATGLGAFPGVVLGVGVAYIGARLFVLGDDRGAWRNLAGIVLTSLGLCVFLGSIRPELGGAIGDMTGGLVRVRIAPIVAFLVGVVALAAPVWFIWAREYALRALESDLPDSVRSESTEREAGGLSFAEAEALMPTAEDELASAGAEAEAAGAEEGAPNPELAALLAAQMENRPELAEELRNTEAVSPYPEDVRLKGEVPEGAVPLASDHDEQPEIPSQPQTVQRWTPQGRRTDDAAGTDLVEEQPELDEAARDSDVAVSATDENVELTAAAVSSVTDDEPADSAEATDAPSARAREPEAPIVDEPVARKTSTGKLPARPLHTDPTVRPLETVERETSVPRPSWEQSSLFADGSPDEEVVAAPEIEAEAELEQPVEEPDAVEEAEAPETELVAEEEEAELEDEESDDPEAVVAETEDEAHAEDDEEWEYVDDEDEESEEDDEYEYEYVYEEEGAEEEDPEAAELDESAEDSEEYEEEEEYEEGEYEEEELDPAASDEEEYDEEEEELEPAASEEEEDEEELEPALAELPEDVEVSESDSAEVTAAQPGSTEAGSEETGSGETGSNESVPAPQGATAEEPQAAEREVVLTPQAPPVPKAEEPTVEAAAPKAGQVTEELIYDAGVLFLERGRVAVSLLQREFHLDFNQSCEVMDRLQDLGLIGPYVGGHRRDILMTREQWLETVTSP